MNNFENQLQWALLWKITSSWSLQICFFSDSVFQSYQWIREAKERAALSQRMRRGWGTRVSISSVLLKTQHNAKTEFNHYCNEWTFFCPQDILNRLTDEEMKCFYEAFKEFDYNNDGHINTKELSKWGKFKDYQYLIRARLGRKYSLDMSRNPQK